MSFKVSFQGFNGSDDPSVNDSDVTPTILEFDTEAERSAFIKGCNMTEQAMDGWVDACVAVEVVEEALPPPAPGYDEAREFLLTLVDLDHDVAGVKIIEWMESGGNRLIPLIQAARDARERRTPEDLKLLDLFETIKQAVLDRPEPPLIERTEPSMSSDLAEEFPIPEGG